MKDNGKDRRSHGEAGHNNIARGTVLEGKITTDGDIRVDGVVKGSIYCKSKLSIGEHGVVEGTVDARNAFIEGTVKGTVIVRELLQLQEKGKIQGDIYTQKLSVQIGATFSGNCRMGSEARSMLNNKEDNPPVVLENTLKEEHQNNPNGNLGKTTASNISSLPS